MRHILISIKPKWADAILAGRKSIELRKTRPSNALGNQNDVAYICYGSKIYGSFRVWFYESVNFMEPGRCDEHIVRSCVMVKEWKAYKPKFAWWLHSVKRFTEPVPLAEIGVARSPQSWQYLTQEQAAELERRTNA